MERIPALDGMRAVAIFMVIAYHVDRDAVPAGWWGVVVFLVLAGYLITRLLCDEIDRHGEIRLKFFYLRRAVRLYPSLLVLCLAVLIAGATFATVSPTLAQYSNYARIAGVDIGLLTHTWFLAVIVHFYLLWPLVIIAVPAKHRLRIVGILALVAIAWRVIAIGVMSPGWVYNATDTNAAALLAGCFLAVAQPRQWRFAGWSLPALFILMMFPVFGDEGSAVLWGGVVALVLSVFAVQYAASGPAWLGTKTMVWLGSLSYGLYLWHYVFLESGMSPWFALPLTFVMAVASWYLLEKPLNRWRKRFERQIVEAEEEQEAEDRDEERVLAAAAG